MQKKLFLCLVVLAGCVSEHSFTDEQSYFNDSDTELLKKTKQALVQRDYRAGVSMLETFIRLYPLSPNSVEVDKLLIELHYRKGEYPMLRAATERFIYEHPHDQDVDYVKYLRFLSSIYSSQNEYLTFVGADYSLRDVSDFKTCYFEAKMFLKDHANSRYAPAVAYELPRLKNIIARYYWLTAEDLYSRMQYIGAVQAYTTILDDFYDTEYAPLAREKVKKFHERYTRSTSLVLE